MNQPYRPISWNRFKRAIDNYLWVGISTYLVLFTLTSFVFTPTISLQILLIRAFGSCAFLVLNIILSIGPLCRLNPMFLPLLYNRRHMGVSCFILAFIHAILVLITYHIGSDMHPIVSVFVSDSGNTIATVPFQTFGAISLGIMFIMAATSHDFWLRHLSPPVWKTLHMLVYIAYGLAVAYTVFGILQTERSIVFLIIVFLGVSTVSILHLVAGIKEFLGDFNPKMNSEEDYVETISVDDIPEKRAKIVLLHGERVAIYRYDGKISALSNVCQHQDGPLGEGKIIDGYIVCPWNGDRYAPETGAAPEPSEQKVPTFKVKIIDGKVWINHKPKLPGTYVEPAEIMEDETSAAVIAPEDDEEEFFIGSERDVPPRLKRFLYGRMIIIFVFVFTLALIIPLFQNRYEPSFNRSFANDAFEGVFFAKPVPHILVDRPGTIPENEQQASIFLLANKQKFGFSPEKSTELNGKYVFLKGSLIFNPQDTMVEVNQDSIREIPVSDQDVKHEALKENLLGTYKMSGTIVSSKCYYGLHNPGHGKFHRACSVRSISNGIPPLLLVKNESGKTLEFMVLGPDGDPIGENILELVEVPIRITGDVYKWGNKYIIHAAPESIVSLE